MCPVSWEPTGSNKKQPDYHINIKALLNTALSLSLHNPHLLCVSARPILYHSFTQTGALLCYQHSEWRTDSVPIRLSLFFSSWNAWCLLAWRILEQPLQVFMGFAASKMKSNTKCPKLQYLVLNIISCYSLHACIFPFCIQLLFVHQPLNVRRSNEVCWYVLSPCKVDVRLSSNNISDSTVWNDRQF